VGVIVLRYKHTILVLILLAVFVIPLPRSDAAQTTEERLGIPPDAKRYYDSKGRLSGAVRNNPHIPALIPLDESYDSEHDLPEVDIVPFKEGIKIDSYRDGLLINTKSISKDQLEKQMGHERAAKFMKTLEKPSADPSQAPGNDLQPRPDRIGATWVKVDEWYQDEWVMIGEICSGSLVDVKLELEFTGGTERAESVDAGPLHFYSHSGCSVSSKTTFWASNWNTWTIYYKFKFKYEYWELQHNWWPSIVYQTLEKWYPTDMYGLSGELDSPYPDYFRYDDVHDDWLTLDVGENKQKRYQTFEEYGFGFDAGVTISGPWHGYGAKVEILSYSNIGGHYSSSEAVYTMYTNANDYHEWAVYEWGWEYGSDDGWGLTFELKV
jgi:hypothetical protein